MGHLSVRDLRVAIDERVLLADLNFEVRSGELLALVGPNGVGKTTLLRALAGLVPARAGTILLDATPLGTMRPRARARAVALIESEPEVAAELRVLEIVRTGRFARRAWWDWTADPEDDAAARTALAAVELAGFGERRIGELSSGERRRVWLALALAQEAHLVLLDEPTAHLDPRHALETICTIRGLVRRGAATIAVFHDLNEAALVADRIALVAEGGFLACDRPERALDPALLERAYGVAFERIIVEGRPRVFVGRAPRATAVS